MNIPFKLNKLHSIYAKVRYAFLAIFVLLVLFASGISARVYGDSVVGTVETRISLSIDGKTKNFTTTQNTIEGALTQAGVALRKHDITEPALNTYLSGKPISVDLIRAIPVLISDNGQSWAASSAYTQPGDILNQLQVEIYPEDKIAAELILDPAAEGMVGQRVVIDRAPVYKIYVDDQVLTVRSWSTNVMDLLTEKGISLGVNDIVEPAKSAALVGVTEITVTRINYADVEEVVAIPYQTVEQKDYNTYIGESKILQNGQNGSKKQSLHIVYKNGIEVERTVTSSEIIEAAKNKIVSVGVKPYGIDDLWPILVSAGSKYGIDPSKMYRVMMCESGGSQFSGLYGRYQGLFQWDKYSTLYSQYSARAGYPGVDIFNVYGQIYATALRVSESGGWGAWGQCQNR